MYTPIPTPAAADFALLVGDAVPEIGEAIAAWRAAADEAYDAIANAEDAADEERTAGARHLAQVREAGRAGAMPQKAPDHHALAEKTAYTAGAADTAIREARAAAKHADAVAQQHAHLAYTVLAERAREAGREATAAAATWQQHRDAAFGALAAAVTAASWAVNGKPSPSGAGSQDGVTALGATRSGPLAVADAVRQEIDADRLARLRGGAGDAGLQGHAGLMRLRVAARAAAAGRADAERASVRDEVLAARAVERVAAKIARKVWRSDEPCLKRALRDACVGDDRQYLGDALALAVESRWIESVERPGEKKAVVTVWQRGPVRPAGLG
jgi:hypothetical protein